MDGATVTEQLIGCARSNNESLMAEIFDKKSAEEIAKIINTTTDPVGSGLLHLAAHHGCLEVLDYLLDQEGVEIDPKDRLQSDTPLHRAVQFAAGPGNAAAGKQIVELLIECGAQPDPRNKSNKRPIDLATQYGLSEIVNSLRGAQYAAELAREAAGDGDGGDGVVDEDEDGGDGEESE